MAFDAVLIDEMRAREATRRWWPGRTINDELDACVAECPDKIALTARRVEDGATTRFTYRELAALADRIAVGLARLGVTHGDVVSIQLPNSWQFTALYLACSRIGAVLNPLMPIFRGRELSFMLAHSESKVMVVPKRFRGTDYEPMLNTLQPQLPALRHVWLDDANHVACASSAAGRLAAAGGAWARCWRGRYVHDGVHDVSFRPGQCGEGERHRRADAAHVPVRGRADPGRARRARARR